MAVRRSNFSSGPIHVKGEYIHESGCSELNLFLDSPGQVPVGVSA